MNTKEERESWHNLKGLFDNIPHTHKFEEAMIPDRENDEVYYYGRCVCGTTES